MTERVPQDPLRGVMALFEQLDVEALGARGRQREVARSMERTTCCAAARLLGTGLEGPLKTRLGRAVPIGPLRAFPGRPWRFSAHRFSIAGMDETKLERIRARWRGHRFGARRVLFDGVGWRLDADVFWSREAVEALHAAPDDVAWLLAEVDRLRARDAGG